MTRLTRRTAPIVAVTLMLALVPGLQKANAEPAFRAPVDNPQLIRSYLQPTSDYSSGHRGVDYRVSFGQPLFAPSSGTIWFAGKVVNREVITVKTADSTALIELEPACASVTTGQSVLVGQSIGKVCDADQGYVQHCSAMRCLHFSYRTKDGYLSPIWIMGQLEPSRLLPWTDV